MINLGPGTLYFEGKPIADVDEVTVDNNILMFDRERHERIHFPTERGATCEFKCRFSKEDLITLFGIKRHVFTCCPNKRVVYLSKHSKRHRTRKKNFNRAIKILERR